MEFCCEDCVGQPTYGDRARFHAEQAKDFADRATRQAGIALWLSGFAAGLALLSFVLAWVLG